MIIKIYQKGSDNTLEVDLLKTFKVQQYKRIDYVELVSRKTKAYDHGTDYDKFFTEFTITGTKTDMITLADYLDSDINQCEITTQDGEYIFGAGIDYTYPFLCNITNSTRSYSQENFATAEIKLSVEALGYINVDVFQVKFRDTITSGLPKLNYQTPIKRTIGKNESDYSLLKFGDSGMLTEVKSNGVPVNNYILDITLAQNFEEAARIENYYNDQRATPFLMSDIDNIDLFPTQDIDNVMITKLTTNRVGLNDWRLSLQLITNV